MEKWKKISGSSSTTFLWLSHFYSNFRVLATINWYSRIQKKQYIYGTIMSLWYCKIAIARRSLIMSVQLMRRKNVSTYIDIATWQTNIYPIPHDIRLWAQIYCRQLLLWLLSFSESMACIENKWNCFHAAVQPANDRRTNEWKSVIQYSSLLGISRQKQAI